LNFAMAANAPGLPLRVTVESPELDFTVSVEYRREYPILDASAASGRGSVLLSGSLAPSPLAREFRAEIRPAVSRTGRPGAA
jgi:hypothetical protein